MLNFIIVRSETQQKQQLLLRLPRPLRRLPHSTSSTIQHVNLPKHQLLMKKSDYHDRITELCTAFAHPPQAELPEKKRRGRPLKVKPIRKLMLKKISSKDTSAEESGKEEPIAMAVEV